MGDKPSVRDIVNIYRDSIREGWESGKYVLDFTGTVSVTYWSSIETIESYNQLVYEGTRQASGNPELLQYVETAGLIGATALFLVRTGQHGIKIVGDFLDELSRDEEVDELLEEDRE